MNVWNNSIAPYDPRKSQLVMGNVQLVAVEVTVSKILRKILRMADESIFRLTLIHAASLPLLGGAGGYFAPAKRLRDANATYAEQFADGAKGIPAVFIGQYVINTAFQGFHMPKISIQDMLITAASKVLSRPLLAAIYPKLHKQLSDNFDVTEDMIQNQVGASNLRMN